MVPELKNLRKVKAVEAMKKGISITVFFMMIRPLMACTIFILTDGDQALFFNNEDFTNPNNRIWFIPGGKDHYGCVFVGYDDGSAQGGLNAKGLAFDWYAGKSVNYRPEAHLVPIDDNSSERMLEQCATVEEAIAFYRTYAEPGFAKASIIIADKSGASVIIGARDGKLFFDKSTKSNVLGGQGKEVFERLYTEGTPINLHSGSKILEQCVATGLGGTLYSNSYNLKTGDIHIYDFSEPDKYITLNLDEELKKGEHYYDIDRVAGELNEPIKPLQLHMKRLILFDYEALQDQEPKISSIVKRIFTDGAMGNLKAGYFTDALWMELKTVQEDLKSELQRLGKLKSYHLVQKENKGRYALYSYVIIFENARLLQQFKLDEKGKVADLQTQSAFVTNSAPMAGGSKDNTIRFTNHILPILGTIAIGFVIFILAKRKWGHPI